MMSTERPRGSGVRRRMAKASRLVSTMMRVGLLAACIGVVAPAAAQKQERLLVWARSGLSDQDLGKGLAPYRVGRQRLGRQGWHVITVPAGMRAGDMRRRLQSNPMFQQIEEDRLHPLSNMLNDTYASSLWHLNRLSVPPAWAVASGMGKGVTVAVIDTGVQADHPDLNGILVQGWNVVDGTANTLDGHGHGTSVMGLLAARINNGVGVAGLASGARIMPIRVAQADGNARTSDIALGIQRAADEGARVVNVSFEGVMGSAVIRSAAQALYRQGGLVFVAAGNRGIEETYAPQPGMVVVGAVDERDVKPSWSSYGAHLTISAPGEGLWTTGLGGGYRVVWGTSFASPLVAAVAALMWEAAPQATPAQVEQWLRESAVDLGPPGPDSQYGHGRLQAAAAVTAARRWQQAQVQGTPTTGSGTSPTGASTGAAPTGAAGTGSAASGQPNLMMGSTAAPTTTPSPLGAVGAWLGLDVDASAAPSVAQVQVWLGERSILTDADEPYAFAINLLDHPKGLLRLRVVGVDASGAEVASALLDVQNNHQGLTVGPLRLTAQSVVATEMRPGTGWTALRRAGNQRIRQ